MALGMFSDVCFPCVMLRSSDLLHSLTNPTLNHTPTNEITSRKKFQQNLGLLNR